MKIYKSSATRATVAAWIAYIFSGIGFLIAAYGRWIEASKENASIAGHTMLN